jgi:aminopeptidase N
MSSLTHAEALARAASIHVDEYRVALDLTSDSGFRSKSTISFSGTEGSGTAFVDIKPRTLRRATLNGVAIDPGELVDGRLRLSGLQARNELVIEAEMAYTNTGQGMHRFVDPADDRVYVYAQCFLDEASTVFACFDQPDLKAPFTVSVTADPEWTVAGNGAATRTGPGTWTLATTKPLATYFVTIIAGPYHRVRSAHDGVPMAILARAALASQLDAQAPEIFATTSACLDRYHELFGVRYPFDKYDQAFVPEFTMGAMENPGCVTFRDEFIFTSAVSDAERESRALVIAHEMAHMWFGDLVTMRWWDDLWLNESFAEYLGHRVTAEVTEFRDSWATFSVTRKTWGYAADQRPSTHPVSGEVADAAQALLNFDGISYAKGASILRQLVVLLGDDAFFAGLRAHFAAHAYGNATLHDLLDALASASRRDLAAWAQVWLRTAGVSTLRPDVAVAADGTYRSVHVIQTSPSTLRPHRIAVATYGLKSPGRIERRDTTTVDVAATARTAITDLAGAPAGDLLLVNDGDLTYAKIRLDATSLDRLVTTLPMVGDALTRALLWGSVWDATRDAQMAAGRFIELCVAAMPTEPDVNVFGAVLDQVQEFVLARYLPPAARESARAAVADVCDEVLRVAPPGSGGQLVAARHRIECAGPDDVARLRDWLDAASKTRPPGLVADPDLRWRIVGQLATLAAVGTAEIDEEYARDRTATGHEHATFARAARPDPEAKRAAWQAIVHDDAMSNRTLFALARGFWRPGQDGLCAAYVERFAADMPAMGARRNGQVTERLAGLAYPAYAVDDSSLAAMIAMRDNEALAPGLRRAVIDETDELARSLAARRLAESTGGSRHDL